jgi:hypothetical protein
MSSDWRERWRDPILTARSNLEAVVGQLFPATLLTRIVTLQMEARRTKYSGHTDAGGKKAGLPRRVAMRRAPRRNVLYRG